MLSILTPSISKAIMDKFVEVWEKDRKLSVKDLKVYFNVEESTAYFVVNEEENLAIYIGNIQRRLLHIFKVTKAFFISSFS